MFDSLIKAIQDARTANIYEGKFHDGDLRFLPGRELEPIVIQSLEGLVSYNKNLAEQDNVDVAAIVVVNHTKVKAVGYADPETGDRQAYIIACADVSEFEFGRYMEREKFQIALAAKFQQTENRDLLVQLVQVLGKLSEDTLRQTDDNGISQTVTVKSGITRVGEVTIPPIVRLTPYRTFSEVDQPESEFLFRMRSGSCGIECALFEADGGAWKLEARESIKELLQSRLEGVPILL